MAKRQRTSTEAEKFLGKRIEQIRLARGITRMQLGRTVNVPEQQIEKYERGALVPLPMLEAIGEALDEPIPKRIIRRISFSRKLEFEQQVDQPDLIGYYDEALPLPDGNENP